MVNVDRRLLYTVELWRYWSEANQIYIRCSLIIATVNAHMQTVNSNSFSNASAKNARGISPPLLLSRFTQHYLVAMATSMTNRNIR